MNQSALLKRKTEECFKITLNVFLWFISLFATILVRIRQVYKFPVVILIQSGTSAYPTNLHLSRYWGTDDQCSFCKTDKKRMTFIYFGIAHFVLYFWNDSHTIFTEEKKYYLLFSVLQHCKSFYFYFVRYILFPQSQHIKKNPII